MIVFQNGVLAQLNMSRVELEKLLKLMRAPGGHCDWCETPVCHGDCPMHELDMLVAKLPEEAEEPKRERQSEGTKDLFDRGPFGDGTDDLLFRPEPGEKPGGGVGPC